MDPIAPFIEEKGFLLLDGGLATHLESKGFDLNHKLWSANILLNYPMAIREVHLDYLRAGSDCIITSSYQCSFLGLKEEGLSQQLAEKLLQKSVKLATEARTIFLAEQVKREGHQFLQPIIAGSIGPYGAYLADGSEYTGDYSITNEALYDFHYRRMEIISNSGVDLLACETIPNVQEARVLDNIIRKLKFPAWISFSCRDSERIHDGTRISECAELLEDNSHIIGIGVNCTAPEFVEALIGDLVKTTSKYIIAYPNSGEIYKPDSKTWEGSTEADYFCNSSKSWKSKGAVILGGCCRTSPRHIRLMHRLLLE